MNYLYISIDAIKVLASIRYLQSADYSECEQFCKVLKGEQEDWSLSTVKFIKSKKGGYLLTTNPEIKRGIIFDFSTFDGFIGNKDENIISIFQKTIKYAIRYFDHLPLVACEKTVPNTNYNIVYPFPFVATKDAFKVLIERNPDQKHFSRKGCEYLLAYACGGNESITVTPSYTGLRKAFDEVSSWTLSEVLSINKAEELEKKIGSLVISELPTLQNLSLNASIGFDAWQHYLTANQKQFINHEIKGPERLEGAAGTGKTLTLILRTIKVLKDKIEDNTSCHIVFVTHSLSTKNQILEIFRSNFSEIDQYLDRHHGSLSLTVTTLQEWCVNFLGTNLSETEFLDRDAQDSKVIQLMYLEQAFDEAKKNDFSSFKLFCSSEFINFFEKTNKDEILEMLQHEVAVTIKGRAGENFEIYKIIPRLTYSIPCENESDLGYLFSIYRKYQSMLQNTGQYDTDDVVLTALGQLNTPIWRRRRNLEGFDICFIDETHLFNINELSVFHYLNKDSTKQNIIFSIDKSQAVGDRGLVDEALFDALGFNHDIKGEKHRLNTIFRSSPDIINLAFNILSTGQTLFTNFENPIKDSFYNFSADEERKAIFPIYKQVENENEMIKSAFVEAESLTKKLDTQRSNILIVATNELLLKALEYYSKSANKPFEILKSRGDITTIKSALSRNRYVLAGIDYVGGLEFDAVIIIGADHGRVPPSSAECTTESYHFLDYAWHNRMYVAVTRAKYAVILIGEKGRGICKMLENALRNEIIMNE